LESDEVVGTFPKIKWLTFRRKLKIKSLNEKNKIKKQLW